MGKIAGILVLLCGLGGSIVILANMPPAYTVEGLHFRVWHLLAAAMLCMFGLGLGALCLEVGRCAGYLQRLSGEKALPDETAPLKPAAPPQAGVLPCPECGKEINEYATVCPRCKTRLKHGHKADPSEC